MVLMQQVMDFTITGTLKNLILLIGAVIKVATKGETMSFNKTLVKETLITLDQYEITSQNIQDRFADIQDKEGIVITRQELEYILTEFYLGISEDIEKGVFTVK